MTDTIRKYFSLRIGSVPSWLFGKGEDFVFGLKASLKFQGIKAENFQEIFGGGNRKNFRVFRKKECAGLMQAFGEKYFKTLTAIPEPIIFGHEPEMQGN